MESINEWFLLKWKHNYWTMVIIFSNLILIAPFGCCAILRHVGPLSFVFFQSVAHIVSLQ